MAAREFVVSQTVVDTEKTSEYTQAHRVYEWSCIAIAVLCAIAFFAGTVRAILDGRVSWSLLSWLAIPLGMVFADATSGFVHWGFDTFGNEHTYLLGPLAIRTFREHHRDQKAMTKHDWVETNGHNIGLSIVLIASATWHVWSTGFNGFSAMLMTAAFFISVTSQIHKWAHMEHVPAWVRTLQRMGLILPPESHSVHHVAPYTGSYFITTGWLNRPFDALRIFRVLEWIVRAPSNMLGALRAKR
jgi:plasmanylethanolamine desaturase